MPAYIPPALRNRGNNTSKDQSETVTRPPLTYDSPKSLEEQYPRERLDRVNHVEDNHRGVVQDHQQGGPSGSSNSYDFSNEKPRPHLTYDPNEKVKYIGFTQYEMISSESTPESSYNLNATESSKNVNTNPYPDNPNPTNNLTEKQQIEMQQNHRNILLEVEQQPDTRIGEEQHLPKNIQLYTNTIPSNTNVPNNTNSTPPHTTVTTTITATTTSSLYNKFNSPNTEGIDNNVTASGSLELESKEASVVGGHGSGGGNGDKSTATSTIDPGQKDSAVSPSVVQRQVILHPKLLHPPHLNKPLPPNDFSKFTRQTVHQLVHLYGKAWNEQDPYLIVQLFTREGRYKEKPGRTMNGTRDIGT